MRQEERYGFFEEPTYIVVDLPFKGSSDSSYSLSLTAVMPREEYTLDEIEQEMNSEWLSHLLNEVEFKQIDLSIPKFKLEATLDAKAILSEMGLNRPFSSAQAEFNLNGGAVITDIVHKAVFEIDELGGTGAAAT